MLRRLVRNRMALAGMVYGTVRIEKYVAHLDCSLHLQVDLKWAPLVALVLGALG
jgi:hypothetical protein